MSESDKDPQADEAVLLIVTPTVSGAEPLDPAADVAETKTANQRKVGTIRPSAMLYTNGVGATVDLPHLSMMPHGLEAWESMYSQQGVMGEVITEARLLELVRAHLGHQVRQLRKPPWAPEEFGKPGRASNLGIPGRIFPQWLRCTGCGLLSPVSDGVFVFENRSRFRPDKARFVHAGCRGWGGDQSIGSARKAKSQPAVPARYLIACTNAHLDEFPYVAWVHRGGLCSSGVPKPILRMREWKSNLGPDVQISCESCGVKRGMLEATGPKAQNKLPMCRGRHPHLDSFFPCDQPGKLMMLGAANQWFSSTIGLLSLPREEVTSMGNLVALIQGLPAIVLSVAVVKEALPGFRALAATHAQVEFSEDVPDDVLWEAIQLANSGGAPTVKIAPERRTDPRTVLAPEWTLLTDESKYTKHSGSADFRATRRDVPDLVEGVVASVVAVEKLKKVNAFIGFTRIDALDRIDDAASRVAPLAKNGKPTWVPATEDRGEGFFLQFDEDRIESWEASVLGTPTWAAFREAHRLNFKRRTSNTAANVDPDSRFPAPRYWAIHTLSHLLIREAAMSSGYGSASLTERIYAWQGDDEIQPAAGLLISTTASDSDGTLGGLVELARPEHFGELIESALRRGSRCSSDPICSHRVPSGKEEFLHGAACHFCLFLSETSCERTNRFLDRRLLLGLPVENSVATPGLLESLVLVS